MCLSQAAHNCTYSIPTVYTALCTAWVLTAVLVFILLFVPLDYLQADVCIWELSPQSGHGNATRTAGAIARLWPNTALWPNLPQLLSTEQTSRDFSSPSTADEVPAANPPPSTASLIHWGALQQLLTDGKYQQKGQLQLVAGGRDALLPAQYHTHDRLLCQVSPAAHAAGIAALPELITCTIIDSNEDEAHKPDLSEMCGLVRAQYKPAVWYRTCPSRLPDRH